jgi:hypothetical protein
LALGEVVSEEIVGMAVGVKPFFGLSTSLSAKNLQSRFHGVTIADKAAHR